MKEYVIQIVLLERDVQQETAKTLDVFELTSYQEDEKACALLYYRSVIDDNREEDYGG